MWEKIKKNRDILYMIAIIVFMFFYVKSCNRNNADRSRIAELVAYEHKVMQYEAQDGTIVNYNQAVTVTSEDLQLMQDTLLEYFEKSLDLKIKDIHSSTIITEKIRIDSIPYPVFLTDCQFDTTVTILDSNYMIDMTLKNTGVMLNTIEIPNRQTVTLAYKRPKWWKKKDAIVTITNSNPYVNTEGISSYTFKQKGKFWKNPWFIGTIGAAIGGVVTWQVVK